MMIEKLKMVPGLDADTIDERVRYASRFGEVCKRVLAYYLCELESTNRYIDLGHSTLRSYTSAVGITKNQQRDLLFAGRALVDLDHVDSAFAVGQINWSQTRLRTRICTPETQEPWLDFATGRTVRVLEEEISRSQKGKLPGEGLNLPRLYHRLIANLDTQTNELWERVQELFEDEKGTQGQNREVLREVFETYLEKKSPSKENEAQASKACAQQDPGQRTDPELRQAVLARDGERCCHCGSQYRLQVHHVKWFSQDGKTRADNLQVLCDRCHMLVHEKLLSVSGSIAEGWVYRDRRGRRTEELAPRACPLEYEPPDVSRDSAREVVQHMVELLKPEG